MSIEPIAAINVDEIAREVSASTATNTETPNFSDWLVGQGVELNEQLNSVDVEIRKFATGETTNIHQVLLTVEKAKLSFELVTQIRNKALEGYQEILRMQV